mgnify:CR=1 FL=1
MNSKSQKILMWFLIGTSALVVTGLIIKRGGKNKAKSKLGRKLVDIANKEYSDWDSGNTKETSSSMYSRLKSYWDSIGWKESRWTPSSVAWSSAFISYIMRKAGAGNKFNYSASHSAYIREARKNREENNSNPIKAYRVNEKKPNVGDLVCYYRGTTSSDPFDRDSSYESHCDVVVFKDKEKLEVIGGNVGQSVTKKNVPLNAEGYVDKGRGTKWFAIIKTS